MKKGLKSFVVVLLILSLFGCGEKTVKIYSSASEIKGDEFSYVEAKLKEQGFTNIKEIVVDDLTSDSGVKDETIESISIDGNDSFTNDDKFPLSAEITIKYHIIKKIMIPYTSDTLASADATSVVEKLQQAGFTNVTQKEEYDLDPDTFKGEFKTAIEVNGHNAYSFDEGYPFDGTVVVVCHRPYEKYTVNMAIDFIPNWIFSKYNVKVYFDDEKLDTLEHGTDGTYEIRTKNGDHVAKFVNDDDSDVFGEIELKDVNTDVDVTYKIYCYSDRISVEETDIDRKVVLGDDEIKIQFDSSECEDEKHGDILNKFKSTGFTNVTEETEKTTSSYKDGKVIKVTINGKSTFNKYDIFKKNSAVVIKYYKYEEEKKEECPFKYAAAKEYVDYTIYYLLDVNNNVAYTFTDYDGSALKGTLSGDSINGFTIKYSDSWSEKIEFFGGWVTLTDKDGYQYEFERVGAESVWRKSKSKINNAYTAE